MSFFTFSSLNFSIEGSRGGLISQSNLFVFHSSLVEGLLVNSSSFNPLISRVLYQAIDIDSYSYSNLFDLPLSRNSITIYDYYILSGINQTRCLLHGQPCTRTSLHLA